MLTKLVCREMKAWHAKFLFFSVVFCLSHLVSLVRPQHCSAAVFGTDLPETRSSSRTGLFINTQSPASCPGILTLWHYCFYNENAGKNGKTRFAIYRRDSGSNIKSYSKVYTEDQISVSIPSSPSFSCRTLTPSQSNFQVEPDDIIAACIHSSNPLDVLAETASGYRVYTPNRYCGNSIPISISLYGDGVLGFAVHVYAEINECGVGNGGCAQVCTDLSVGYECSCSDGYTPDGDGVSCNDVDECAVNNGGCDHICDNDEGSFECHCNDGFLLEEDGLTCLSNSGSNTTGAIAGAVVVLFFIAMVISVGVLLIVVMYRRRRKSALPDSGNVQSVAANSVPSFKKSPGVQDQEANYELIGDEDSHLYSVLEPPDYGTVINEARQNNYVDNKSPYQVPASDEEDIYAQLKQQCISRIPSGSIKLNEHLGSGYFGTVDKGVWSHSKGTKEVAVKALKEDATRTDRVKFLQEAAIMGQFRHPSVIQLYGVAARGKTL